MLFYDHMILTGQHKKLTHMDMVAYNIFSCVCQDVLLTNYHNNKLQQFFYFLNFDNKFLIFLLLQSKICCNCTYNMS